jgi:hypothetical protein
MHVLHNRKLHHCSYGLSLLFLSIHFMFYNFVTNMELLFGLHSMHFKSSHVLVMKLKYRNCK